VWHAYQLGKTLGTRGSENGLIAQDEEHAAGARITLETGITFGGVPNSKAIPFAITCGLYGWFVHTRYFLTADEAQAAFDRMKEELERIIEICEDDTPGREQQKPAVFEAISDFVERFPT
jgi:hypothetical protein